MLLSNWLTRFIGRSSLARRVLRRQRHGSLRVSAEMLEDRTLLAAPHPFDLSTLDGTNGFRLDGIDEDDRAGRSVRTAGDVNGDGFDDILVGAYGAAAGGDAGAGETYVVFGANGGFAASLDLATLDGTNGFRLDGIDDDDFLGYPVGNAGDVNGDGSGNDIVQGDDGKIETSLEPDNDHLDAGPGDDTVRGGGDSDVYIAAASEIDETFAYWAEWVDAV